MSPGTPPHLPGVYTPEGLRTVEDADVVQHRGLPPAAPLDLARRHQPRGPAGHAHDLGSFIGAATVRSGQARAISRTPMIQSGMRAGKGSKLAGKGYKLAGRGYKPAGKG